MKIYVVRRKIVCYISALLTFVSLFLFLQTGRLYQHDRVYPCPKGSQLCGSNKEKTIDRMAEYTTHVSDDIQYAVATQPLKPGIVVYNRVPKCASSSMRWIIKSLKVKNHFHHIVHNWPNVKQRLTQKEEKDLVHEISSSPKPELFLRHLHFVDFEKYNVTQPAYINLIRHPVDRFVSHYYFSRFGFVHWDEEKIKKWLWPMPEDKRNMTIEECAYMGAEKCVRDNNENMIEFFCGQDARCRNRDDWSLARAKENIGKNYVVVGILEQFEESIKVLEAVLPRFFSGAEDISKRISGGISTKTAHKVEPSSKARQVLTLALSREIDLYEYVKNRFSFQLQKLREVGLVV